MKIPQSVVVTGAQGALGIHVVNQFLKAGCHVTGVSRSYPSEHFEFMNHKNFHWITLDVSQSSHIKEKFPTEVDALIHCAGGFRFVAIDQFTDEDLDFLINCNLKSALLLTRHILPSMKEKNFGRIIFVGAKATLNPTAGMGLYTASKVGLNALASSIADEVRHFDINVNTVLPSIIDTPANRNDMPGADFSTWVDPVELAEIIFSLTQPWGKSINGGLIPVGGRV